SRMALLWDVELRLYVFLDLPLVMNMSKSIEEKDFHGNHPVLSCSLVDGNSKIPSYALIDCGATGYAFVDEKFGCHHDLPLYPLKNPCNIEVIDGRPIESGHVTHLAKAKLTMNTHTEMLALFVMKLYCKCSKATGRG